MSTASASASSGVPRPAAAARPHGAGVRALPRLAAFAALTGLGLVTWAGLVAPAPRGAAIGTALAAAAGAAALLGAGAIDRRAARNGALAAVSIALALAMLLGAGIPVRLLLPGGWAELVRGIAGGIGALPGTFVPYGGPDVWIRRTLLLGGTALTGIAVLQGFWPRERGRLPGSAGAAVVSLGTLYAVPVISTSPERPFLSGALFTVLLCGLLLADRLRPSMAAPAALLVLAATVGAAALAPALDRPRPWVDYEHLAEDVAARGTVVYHWDHTYGPIDWPRKGRELLRIRAQAPAYWKTEVLDTFDGRGWRAAASVAALEPDGDQDRSQPQWFQTIRVRVRGLRTRQFVTAGSATRITDAPRRPINAGAGTFVTERGVLRRGAEYRAQVYTPRPTAGQLSSAADPLGSIARQWLRVALPAPGGGAQTGDAAQTAEEVSFPPFGSDSDTLVSHPGSPITTSDGPQVLRASALRRIYELSRRLRAQAATPYDYVRLVRSRVGRGAAYTERPAVHANPLDAFLFTDRRGYCQHFSGAMALLLRMGGIPARVAVGFSPGTLDRRGGEYVVRDLDAHSWVEAYFPRYGWVTFDPTPSASPAREQVADQQAALTRPRGRDPGSDRASDPGFGARQSRPGAADGGPAWWPAAVCAVVLLAAALVARRRSRRGRRRGTPLSDDPQIAALERALERTGRELRPGETLADVERRLGATPGARAYLRALSDRRYGTGGPPPTAAQRAALRRELAAGLGRLGRLRAWLALPPYAR